MFHVELDVPRGTITGSGSMSHDAFAQMTSDVLESFSGGKNAIKIHTAQGIKSTTAYLSLEIVTLGDDPFVSEDQWVAHIDLVAGLEMKRGDRLETENGDSFILRTRQSKDEWAEVWAVELKS